jgi:ribonuclease HI
MITIWFDGFCDGNPCGKGGIGVLIEKDGKELHTISEYIGEGECMTNNVAEYEA